MFKRVGATAGAITAGFAGNQFPAYFAQYVQRFGGHADEALRAAEQTADPRLIERAYHLRDSLDALLTARPIADMFVFAQTLEPDIASRALEHYRVGISLDPAGLAYAGTGVVVGATVGAVVAYLGERSARSA